MGRTAKAISTGSRHTCAILDNDKVKCWGDNDDGQLGLGDTDSRGDDTGEMGDNLPYVDLGTGRTAKAVSTGYSHTCAILDNDKVKCWGDSDDGQLGLGDIDDRGDDPNEMGDNLLYVDLGMGRTAKAISTGGGHTCAILDNDKIKCWGHNGDRVRFNEMVSRGSAGVDLGTGRTAKAVSTGGDHTCAILDNDKVKCWGLNRSGQLGLGDTDYRGDDTGEMGDNLPYVDLGTGRTAKAISTGSRHTCAILDNDKVKCWGLNRSGQLGLGDTDYRGDDTGEMGDNLPYVDLGTGRTAKAVSTGGWGHTCAILDNDKVKCWGLNGGGELGLGDTDGRGDDPNEMGDNLLYVDLGMGRTAKAVSTGGWGHTCAILDNDKTKCWGRNNDGELGLGDTDGRGDDPNEMGDNLLYVDLGTGRTAKAVSTGYSATPVPFSITIRLNVGGVTTTENSVSVIPIAEVTTPVKWATIFPMWI